MKRMRRECDEKMNQQNNGCTGKPGVLVLTHLIAVAIGAGVLYCVLFMKKIKRTLKGRIKDERNKETNSVSHNPQKGSMENLSTPCLKEDEGVYCEVAEKPQPKSSQFANFAYSVAEDSVLEGRKNLRLPDIPQQAMKDDNQYLTPISRSLPNEYLDSSGKALKDENEIWSEDEKVQNSNVLNHDDRLNDAFDTETIDNYFVLENSTDMDLK
ncbi:uncharacterized protein LOC134235694 [Saccostrea cucullata]|uniref:uncharacterized protein LOC134235694 n=1 Tax=Saccostrea cuccullata TaxID=36930 RepID=UPI002ED10FA5